MVISNLNDFEFENKHRALEAVRERESEFKTVCLQKIMSTDPTMTLFSEPDSLPNPKSSDSLDTHLI